jgi:protease-4
MLERKTSPSRQTFAVLGFIAAFLVLAIIGRLILLAGGETAAGGGRIAQLSIEGVITASSAPDSLFAGGGTASSVEICNDLYDVLENPDYAGVLLRIDSPGGSAAGSDEIYRAVTALRKAGKPVVVSMGDVAASGGYYIASAADHVIANAATLTGSIGVIFEFVNWEEGAAKLGIDDVTLHAGEFKDIGSPWRAMKPEERAMLDKLLDEVHQQFIDAVDEGREPLDRAAVAKLATGMIYTGQQAKGLGLIDAVGGLEDARVKVRELAKLPEDAAIDEYGGVSFMDELLGVRASLPADGLDLPAVARRYAEGTLAGLADQLFLSVALRHMRVR